MHVDPMGRFQGGLALVTGAGSGIGFATACLLARGGCEVVGTCRSQRHVELLTSNGIQPMEGDLTSPEFLESVVLSSSKATLLVNAAGANDPLPLGQLQRSDLERLFEINCLVPFTLCQQLGMAMPPGGAIVNVSSTAAISSVPEVAAYGAAKAALLSLTRSFAQEYGPRGVRVNAVLPKIIDTPMQQSYLASLADQVGKTPEELNAIRIAQVPLGRAGTPEECASVIGFLLSSASNYMTGQSINVCGGWMMR